MLFMIPLPGPVVDFLTMPMKMAVSYVAENILFWFDYPIARTGVILQIGQYKLLVADACAGLAYAFYAGSAGLALPQHSATRLRVAQHCSCDPDRAHLLYR